MVIVLQTAVYIAEPFIIQWNFSDLKNPRFIIESSFKSRVGYNGARTYKLVDDIRQNVNIFQCIYLHHNWQLLNSPRKLTQTFGQSFDFMLENCILQNPFRILLKPIIWVIRESCIFIYADDINLQKYASNVASIQSQKSKTIPRSALRSEPNTLR